VAIAVPPEIITLDASGKYQVQIRALDDLGNEYRMSSATALIAEDAPWAFPLSVVGFVWFPYLWIVFPIGTGLLGIIRTRRPRR